MQTVRGDTGPQDRPFQTVENYQGGKSPPNAENEVIKYLPQSRLPTTTTDSLPHQSLSDIYLPVRSGQCLDKLSGNH